MKQIRSISKLYVMGFALLSVALLSSDASPAMSIVLEIDGKSITSAELQKKNANAVFQARNALFEAERKAVNEFIEEYLLERQAKAENLTVEQLLQKHAYSTLPAEPSEEALRVYYDGLDTAEPFDSAKHKIRDLVRERRMGKARTAYTQSLRSTAKIVLLVAPPRAQIEIGDAPVRGTAGAKVTIIEYADYECPYCQQIKPVVDRIEQDYKGKIAFAFKDVPLPMHANAQKAAEAAHCAGAQGKFWQFHDRLFLTKMLGAADLKEHASALSLDTTAFARCLESGAQAQRIKTHVQEAQSIALPGTPGFFVNGRFVSGAVDYDSLRQVVEEELRAVEARGSKTATARQRVGTQ